MNGINHIKMLTLASNQKNTTSNKTKKCHIFDYQVGKIKKKKLVDEYVEK